MKPNDEADATESGEPPSRAGAFEGLERLLVLSSRGVGLADDEVLELIEQIPTGAVCHRRDRLLANRRALAAIGHPDATIPSLDAWFTRLYPRQAEEVRAVYEADFAAGFPERRVVSVHTDDGSLKRIAFAGRVVGDASALWILEDLSELDAARRARDASESRYRTIVDALPDTVLLLDAEGTCISTHRPHGFGGTDDCDAFPNVGEPLFDGPHADPELREAVRAVATTGVPARVHLHVPEGKLGRAVDIECRLVQGLNGELLALMRDITESLANQRRLDYLASHDDLTGLTNRRRFTELLGEAARDGSPFVLAFIDLDRFKLVNDGHGHSAGDHVLVHVSDRLARAVGDAGIVARFAGDEFVVLLPTSEPVDAVRRRVRGWLDAISPRIAWKDQHFTVHASAGLVLSQDGWGAHDYLTRADAAMYESKQLGRNAVVVFEPAMGSDAGRILRLGAEIEDALQRGQIVPFYQPIFSMETGRLAGAEALIRWVHPERGVLEPAEFLSVAHRTDLEAALVLDLVRRAVEDLRRWSVGDGASEGLRVSVNVTARMFHSPDFPLAFESALAGAPLTGGRLCVELTEEVLLRRLRIVRENLRWLEARQIDVHLDDFGVGYSSLSVLRDIPSVRALKIDRSFVRGLSDEASPRGRALLESIVAMGRALGLVVIAEGVETATELDELRRMGCSEAQGFLLGKPMSAEAFACLVREAR